MWYVFDEHRNLADKDNIPPIYGFHINPNESDPYESVTYIGSAVGMTPAYMDYDTGTFNYGSWEDAFFMPRPCMLKYDGTVDYYLNPNDYTKKEDGTASDISNTAYEGNAMMEWGRNGNKIWWKIIPTDNGLGADIYVSEYQLDDGYHAYSFIKEDGTYTDHFYTPIYSGSLIDDKLRSISGQTNLASVNATTEITYATANGEGWYTETWCDRILINILLTLISKNLNVQSAFGNGNLNYINDPEQNYGIITTGTMDDKGMFWGSNTSGTSSTGVKVFGMENYWANQWRRVAGFMQRSGEVLLKMTPPYNTTGDNYETMEGLLQKAGSYVRNFKFDGTLGFIPSVRGGSSSTYYSDYYWINIEATCYLIVGGHVYDGLHCGSWCLALNNSASNAYWHIGVAPSYR